MHPKIASLLAKFPRIELIKWETPVQYLPKVSAKLGVDVYVKRDDLTGFGIGGNKVRKLEFLLGDAMAKGCDTVITTGPFTPTTPSLPLWPRRASVSMRFSSSAVRSS